MTHPQCAICQCYITSGRCWICQHCREEFSIGNVFNDLPDWVKYLVNEERTRRRNHKVVEIDFSELSYCDRAKVEQTIGEQDND